MSGFSTARQNMVDCQVRPSDVTDNRIIDAMLEVPREVVVPQNQRPLAYLDLDLDVGEAGAKRFLIKPAVLARMLQAAEIKATDKVLVAGCATGYAAAIVAKFAGELPEIESDPGLAEKAKAALTEVVLGRVAVPTADVANGQTMNGPYDVIVLN